MFDDGSEWYYYFSLQEQEEQNKRKNMIIDLSNVETNQYVNEAGKQHLKVIKVEESKSNAGNDMLVVTFQNQAGEKYQERIALTQKALWKLKVLTKALKMPNTIDTNDMLNRYVYGYFVEDKFVANDGTEKISYRVNKWEESPHTNTLTQEPNTPQPPKPSKPTDIELEDDEIPF